MRLSVPISDSLEHRALTTLDRFELQSFVLGIIPKVTDKIRNLALKMARRIERFHCESVRTACLMPSLRMH